MSAQNDDDDNDNNNVAQSNATELRLNETTFAAFLEGVSQRPVIINNINLESSITFFSKTKGRWTTHGKNMEFLFVFTF